MSKLKISILAIHLVPHQSQYIAWLLSRRIGADSAGMLATTLVDAQVDLNPHQACRILDRQDEIDQQRNRLIESLESRLTRQVSVVGISTIQWSLE
ncbi:MAG: SNF2-like protein [Comamonadaceae bacterium]|nr:MAG: SNF2-like protein [Comamonadaceae bacterium]